VLLLGDERGGEHDVVAVDAVDGTSHRVGHETARHCLALDASVELPGGVERRPGRPVAHQLDAAEQAAPAQVADVRVANVHGKVKRQGRYAGRRPDWKKAFVVLKKGEKSVEFFEQA